MRRSLDRLRARHLHGAPDAGVTLIEVVVAMSIMSIFLAMFTASILQIYRSVNRIEAAVEAQSEISIAVGRLDKEIRYAAGISRPGVVGADLYVEYLLAGYYDDSGVEGAVTARCVQLRLRTSTKQLQQREWEQGKTPLVPSAWTELASGVTATVPFTLTPADAVAGFQRLTLKIAATSGTGTKATDITFTALNTSAEPTDAVCTEGRTVA